MFPKDTCCVSMNLTSMFELHYVPAELLPVSTGSVAAASCSAIHAPLMLLQSCRHVGIDSPVFLFCAPTTGAPVLAEIRLPDQPTEIS